MIFEIISLVLLIICLILIIFLRRTILRYNLKKEIHESLKYDYKSMNVKHGKSFEQLFPFMSNYPYSPENFRFIGTPIDGLSFEDNKIVFFEFKTGTSRLSQKQKRIKELVELKKVEWEEVRDN